MYTSDVRTCLSEKSKDEEQDDSWEWIANESEKRKKIVENVWQWTVSASIKVHVSLSLFFTFSTRKWKTLFCFHSLFFISLVLRLLSVQAQHWHDSVAFCLVCIRLNRKRFISFTIVCNLILSLNGIRKVSYRYRVNGCKTTLTISFHFIRLFFIAFALFPSESHVHSLFQSLSIQIQLTLIRFCCCCCCMCFCRSSNQATSSIIFVLVYTVWCLRPNPKLNEWIAHSYRPECYSLLFLSCCNNGSRSDVVCSIRVFHSTHITRT